MSDISAADRPIYPRHQVAKMRRYLLSRLLLLVPVVFGVLTVVFLVIHLTPGDPVEIMLGEAALAADKAKLRAELGLDKPLLVQYFGYMTKALRGDLGRSIVSRRPVLGEVIGRVPATIELALASLALAIAIALPLGIISALRHRTIVDNGSMAFALLGIAMPNFWIGPMLIILFSIKLDLLPVSGRGGISHLVLPAITLGTALAAILTRMTRSSMLDVIKAEYIKTARAKGLAEVAVICKHALSNALIPILTVVGLQLGALLSGAVITETIFSWPGIGRLAIQAISQRDYPLVQGVVLVIAISYVIINLIIDILYAFIDPRIRLGGGR